MGRIRTKDVKDVAKEFYEAYPENFGKDFAVNKEKIKETGLLKEKSKRYMNRVAGYIVRVARKGENKPEDEEVADE